MLKRTITYTDYEGNTRTEDFYFNLSQAEVMKMEMSEEGGLEKLLKKIIAEQNHTKIMEYFDDFIMRSYGEKSPDGKRFVKSSELSKAFSETEAYSILFMELCTDAKAASAFVNAVLPNAPAKTEEANGVPANVAAVDSE